MEYMEMKTRLAESAFRSRFKLTRSGRIYIAERSWPVIEAQARKIVIRRLAPAFPVNDGCQTPMRGHVVFVAQHATATCCRGCLSKWYGIASGMELTPEQINHVVSMIIGWLLDQAGDLSDLPHTPELIGYANPLI